VILKKPTFLLIVLSLVLTLVLAVPQTALAVPGVCPEGTDLIAKYEWNGPDNEGPDGWYFEKYYDIITFGPDEDGDGPDAQNGSWDSGGFDIDAVVITDGKLNGISVTWTYEGNPPFPTNFGYYHASDMLPEVNPTRDISNILFCGDIFPVTLAAFSAQANRGIVTVKWVTATEINTAGFIVYRSTTRAGPRVQATAPLIAAQGDGVTGASYSVTDSPGYGTFYYWLEDVDYSGQSSLHGPVVVNVLSPIRLPAYRPSLPGQ